MNILNEDKGSIAIIMALLLSACIGFAALSIDVGIWYVTQRQLQIAADTGAIGGAMALSKKGASTVVAEATYDMSLNGCTSSNNCTIVAINNPPTSGPNTGNSSDVEVILTRPADLYLAALFLSSGPLLKARSVAGIKPSSNCLITLGTSGIGLDVKGGATLNANNCGVYVNSSSSNGVNVVGGGVVNDKTLNVVGSTNTSGGGVINSTNGTSQGVSPTSDPYSGIQIPAYSGCDQTKFSTTTNATISPGVYCGGIQISSSAVLTMNPGTYILDQGDFQASGQTTIIGHGVTIILTSSSGSKYGAIQISAGATTNLSAPTTAGDPLAGILIYGDRNASVTSKLTGGSTQILSGIVYLPNSSLEYAGQAAGGASNPCLQLVANDVTITGGAELGNGCGQTAAGTILLLE